MAGYLAVGLAIGLFLLASGDLDQAQQIRALRSTIRNSMTPVTRLSEAAPGQDSWLEFMDKPCEQDCSGHLAGWHWAAKRGVVKYAQCDGSNSTSFAEGCRTYLERMTYEPDPN